MKLYYSKGACSLAPHLLINELNLPCDFEAVDLKTKRTEKQNDFLKINPKGAVPVLVTPDNEILTENAVILQYLADSHPANELLPPTNDFNRYRVLEWLNYITTELHKSFGPLFNNTIPQNIKDDIFIPLLKKKFDYVNENFKTPYLMGETLKLPDFYLFVILRWLNIFKIEVAQWPNLDKFFSHMKEKDSVIRTLQAEGLQI